MIVRVIMVILIIEEGCRLINNGPCRPGSKQALPEIPGDRLAQALLEGKTGFEAQPLAGLADVGHPAVRLHLLDFADVEEALPPAAEAVDAFRGGRGQVRRPEWQGGGGGRFSEEPRR